jgi:hypothetical protein
MYFNNPDIIKTETDVILGAVKTDDENLNFLSLINRTIQFYAYHIRQDVIGLMSETVNHKEALELTAKKIYTRLDMYRELTPKDEEGLAELMMQSRNFEMWEADIKRRFFETHSEKVDVKTKIPVTKEGGVSQEEIKEIKENTNLDLILEKLSMYIDLGNPTND